MRFIAITNVLLLLSAPLLGSSRAQTNEAPPKQQTSSTCGLKDKFFLTGDYLYWKADIDHMSYATYTTGFDATPFSKLSSFDVSIKTQYKELHPRWDSGFRLGMGVYLGHEDRWDIYVNWTDYHTKARGKAHNPDADNVFLTPSWAVLNATQTTNFTSTRASWHLKYNTVDLELGRKYLISNKVSVRPHIGARAAFIDQKLKGHAMPGKSTSGRSNTAINTASLVEDTPFHGTTHYNAVGVRGGANLMWHFSPHWGIIGQLSGALVYGKYNIHERTTFTTQTSGVDPIVTIGTTNIVKDHFYRTRTNFQGLMGLQWESCFNRGKQFVSFTIAYEFLEWFNQNQFTRIEANFANTAADITRSGFRENSGGDLGLQGLTLNAMFRF